MVRPGRIIGMVTEYWWYAWSEITREQYAQMKDDLYRDMRRAP